jgi:hypothetical protein
MTKKAFADGDAAKAVRTSQNSRKQKAAARSAGCRAKEELIGKPSRRPVVQFTKGTIADGGHRSAREPTSSGLPRRTGVDWEKSK